MFGTRVFLHAAIPCAAVFPVVGLYDTSLFPAPCIVGAIFMLGVRLIVFMSRSQIFVIRTLIGQWGSVVDAGHGTKTTECRFEGTTRSGCGVLTVLLGPDRIHSMPVSCAARLTCGVGSRRRSESVVAASYRLRVRGECTPHVDSTQYLRFVVVAVVRDSRRAINSLSRVGA